MRHGNQFELAVVDAEDFVAFEIQAVHIALNLLVVGGVAKAQIAVLRLQRQQMLRNALTVVWRPASGSAPARQALGRGRAARAARRHGAGEKLPPGLQRCLDKCFGINHGLNIRVFPEIVPVRPDLRTAVKKIQYWLYSI